MCVKTRGYLPLKSLQELGYYCERVLLWMGAVFWSPSTSLSSLFLLLGQETCRQHFPESLACWHPLRLCPGKCWQDWRREAGRAFLVFLAEHPGSHSNVAAGSVGSGRSFQPGLQCLWLQAPCHTIFPCSSSLRVKVASFSYSSLSSISYVFPVFEISGVVSGFLIGCHLIQMFWAEEGHHLIYVLTSQSGCCVERRHIGAKVEVGGQLEDHCGKPGDS